MFVEATRMGGEGKITLTGQLGKFTDLQVYCLMAKNRPRPSTVSSTESKLESFVAFQLTELASSIVMSVIKTGQSLLSLEITSRVSQF